MPGDPIWLQELAQQILTQDINEFRLWVFVCILAALTCFVFGFLALHKARLLENTPTSRVRSAAQGYIELTGFARLMQGPEIFSPLTGLRCCWWRYRVQEQETVWRNGKRSSQWRTIESATSDDLFLLADDTGDCIVDADGGTIEPSISRTWRGEGRRPARVPERTPWLQMGRYRYHEQLIQIGDPLYAIGWFRTQSNYRQADEAAEVTELLREWKADRRGMLERFDTDGNGEIDMAEWEAARRAAIEQVRQEHLEHALDPDLHVLSRPPDRRPYILSTRPQEAVVGGLRLRGIVLLCLSAPLAMAGVFGLAVRGLL